MRTMIIISLLATGVFAGSSYAADNRSARSDTTQWLSIPEVHAKLESAGYRNIEKIERERGSYEVKAIDRNGQRMKLYVHPQSGAITDQQQRDSGHHGHDTRSARNERRNSADCNERRCRDDLPPAGNAVSPISK